jgi:hypothetical protein
MQLLNDTSHNGSAVLELMASLVLVAGVSAGVYVIQHPHVPPAAQVSAVAHQ